MADSVQKRFQNVKVDILTGPLQIEIFPNPATNQLTIERATGAKVLLCNSLGQKLIQFSVNAGKQMTNLSTLPAGMYLLYIKDKTGG